MENELNIFDTTKFLTTYSDHFKFKKDGIEISYLNFGNTNFSLDSHFVNQCRKAVNVERKNFDLHELSSNNDTYEKIEIVFKNCKFTNVTVNEQILKDHIFIEHDCDGTSQDIKNLEMNFLRISGSKFQGKFYINKQYDGNSQELKISKIIIENTIFHDNYKLHRCEIGEIIFKDDDFEKNADFYMSKFLSGAKNDDSKEATEINFHALNFKDLALFGDVHFYKKFHLRYVTLEGYSHFRNAIFDEGLDLDYTNIQNEMNFFGAEGLSSKLSKQNTSQETYRIIKHNFMKLNNVIEANKYHSLELNTHRKNISFIDVLLDCKLPIQNSLDWIVSIFHLLSSNYSKNWLITLVWIIVVSTITNLSLEHEIFIQEKINWESIFKYINILTSINDFVDVVSKEKSYVAMTLNKILLGYLYYQFLTTIRRNTKS